MHPNAAALARSGRPLAPDPWLWLQGIHLTWVPLSKEGKFHRMRDGMLYNDVPVSGCQSAPRPRWRSPVQPPGALNAGVLHRAAVHHGWCASSAACSAIPVPVHSAQCTRNLLSHELPEYGQYGQLKL